MVEADRVVGAVTQVGILTTIQRCAVSVGALWARRARQLECLRCPAATRRVARAPFTTGTSNTPAVTRHRRNPTDQTSSRSRLICASPATFKTEEWRRTAAQTARSLTYQMPISSTSSDLTSAGSCHWFISPGSSSSPPLALYVACPLTNCTNAFTWVGAPCHFMVAAPLSAGADSILFAAS